MTFRVHPTVALVVLCVAALLAANYGVGSENIVLHILSGGVVGVAVGGAYELGQRVEREDRS